MTPTLIANGNGTAHKLSRTATISNSPSASTNTSMSIKNTPAAEIDNRNAQTPQGQQLNRILENSQTPTTQSTLTTSAATPTPTQTPLKSKHSFMTKNLQRRKTIHDIINLDIINSLLGSTISSKEKTTAAAAAADSSAIDTTLNNNGDHHQSSGFVNKFNLLRNKSKSSLPSQQQQQQQSIANGNPSVQSPSPSQKSILSVSSKSAKKESAAHNSGLNLTSALNEQQTNMLTTVNKFQISRELIMQGPVQLLNVSDLIIYLLIFSFNIEFT
jgi:hypothetical protein